MQTTNKLKDAFLTQLQFDTLITKVENDVTTV
jgi:hypothetical protein